MAKRKTRSTTTETEVEDFELEEVETTPLFTFETTLVVLTTIFLIVACAFITMALRDYYGLGPLA